MAIEDRQLAFYRALDSGQGLVGPQAGAQGGGDRSNIRPVPP